MSIQIHAYIFQTRFLYSTLFFVYTPIFVSISRLSSSIYLYLFINPDWYLSLSISLLIQIHAYLFQSRFLSLSILHISTYICFYLLSIHLYFLIPLSQSRLISISFYLFVNSNSRLTFSIPFSLSLSILCISSYICFYLLSIHLYFLIPLCQSWLMPISFYLFVNSNSRLYLSTAFSLYHSILCISTYICFYLSSIQLYLFISRYHSRLMPISFNTIFFFSAQSSSIHLCLFLSLFNSPLFLSISCLSKFKYISLPIPFLLLSAYLSYIDLYLFLSFCVRVRVSV